MTVFVKKVQKMVFGLRMLRHVCYNSGKGGDEVGGSNYEKVRQEWRQRFLEMDCGMLAKRFGLKLDENALYVTYFSRPYAIDRRTARIVRTDAPETEIGFDLEMNFFNMFHYAVESPQPSGELVPFRSVKRVYPFEAAYRKSILVPFANCFAGRAESLRCALAALKALPLPKGDAAGRLEILPGLCMEVYFWDGDDEFPAQANMLFDSNITDYMHEENVVMVASDAASFLIEESGLRAEAEVGFGE